MCLKPRPNLCRFKSCLTTGVVSLRPIFLMSYKSCVVLNSEHLTQRPTCAFYRQVRSDPVSVTPSCAIVCALKDLLCMRDTSLIAYTHSLSTLHI